MPHPARHIANAFLQKAKEAGNPLTQLKLQKLVFFAHAWNLAIHNRPLLNENIEAWPYGPVVDGLYHELKGYGSQPIDRFLTEINQQTGQPVAYIPGAQDAEAWSMINQVWDRYSQFSALTLSDMTHAAGSPWHQARQANMRHIDNGAIANFYRPALQS
ncbi:Panacea domain-containing protein [Variovorax sp. LT2P21]|uniref:Panacea domain-containing protein n=1 Tax=Variovorax sp. LT2P21 TaxID=3443731 RepID=UPI003F482CE1